MFEVWKREIESNVNKNISCSLILSAWAIKTNQPACCSEKNINDCQSMVDVRRNFWCFTVFPESWQNKLWRKWHLLRTIIWNHPKGCRWYYQADSAKRKRERDSPWEPQWAKVWFPPCNPWPYASSGRIRGICRLYSLSINQFQTFFTWRIKNREAVGVMQSTIIYRCKNTCEKPSSDWTCGLRLTKLHSHRRQLQAPGITSPTFQVQAKNINMISSHGQLSR